MRTLSVTELNNQIKSLLESTFERVSIEGEVSNVTYHTSGHIYFSIKDENSSLRCVMFRGNASKLKFKIETGIHIVCDAAISVYTPRGEYQLNCFSATPAGSGALALAYEQLKKRLMQKGYFEENIKKELPKVPKKVAIVTSATGAAIQDMLKVAAKRWNLLKVVLINTTVQGASAAFEIARNIEFADRLGCDAIVIGRGGGSIEDLWAFNEEVVADAVFNAKTPVISAVGHETDFVISDFVADKRAPTPSAAMELLLPDQVELLHYIDILSERVKKSAMTMLDKKSEELFYAKRVLYSKSMSSKVRFMLSEADTLRKNISRAKEHLIGKKQDILLPVYQDLQISMRSLIRDKEHKLMILSQRVQDADPKKRLLPNSAQIVKDEKSVSLFKIEEGDRFMVMDSEFCIESKALKKTKLE